MTELDGMRLTVLDDLAYVFECLAANLTGEAKHQLHLLATGSSEARDEFAEVRAMLVAGDREEAITRLTVVSRRLWGEVLR